MKQDKPSAKTVIRIALDSVSREALDLLKRIKYPFLKDDAIFKLAFSQLYSGENIISNKQTTVINILMKIRTYNPEFGKQWLKEKDLHEEEMGVEEFTRMIIDLTHKK